MAQRLPPLTHYIRTVAEKKLETLQPKLGKLGRLDVLGTDPARDYMGRLAQLDLKGLPQDQLITLSRLLHHYFKAQRFPNRPLGVEAFEPALQTPYDYVLVDSRTGITEIGGLCVGPLADRLVVITGLNDQNVHGTLDFMKEVGIQPKPRPQDDQPWDDADTVGAAATDNPSLGPKPTILVASPVPSGETAYKRRRLRELEKLIGIHPVSLSYHSLMALMETVFVRDYTEENLADEYKRLATSVMAQVGDDPLRLAAGSRVLWNDKKDLPGAINRVLRLAAHIPELGVTLLGLLEPAGRESDGSHIPEMRQLYAVLSQNAETRLAALNNWGLTLAGQAETKTGQEADRLFEEAGRKYAEALRLKSDRPQTLCNWGGTLYDQAKTKAGEEADRLFEEAGRKYGEALRLKPDFPEALSNWGNALAGQANTKAGQEAGGLFEEAGRKYGEALRIKPDFPEALGNWGFALLEQAKMKAGEGAGHLLQQARQNLLEAEQVRAGCGAYNLACVEAIEGNTREAVRWLQLFKSAGRRLARAEIAADKGFDRVRNEPEFVSLVESLTED
jgi:tetratricopeptide (TPR) repeat protein